MKKISFFKAILFVAAILANLYYLGFVLDPAHAGNRAFWVLTTAADALVVVVFVSTWTTALFFEIGRSRYVGRLSALRARAQDGHGPPASVAVLVTVVNEDLTVVRKTLESALDLVGEKTVYLLDDGKSDATQRLAARLGVRYVRRSGADGYKAGNVNNALLLHVREAFAVLVDADFALRPQFIERTMPLFADPSVAAVQTPQIYGNADTLFSRGCKHLQDIFYGYLQPGKDLSRSAFCVGTNVIFRMKALREVGGLREMHSEDIFTTVTLLERGYRVAFLDEELAVGLSPSTLASVYTQQNRWARGAFMMMLKHNTLFNRKLAWAQRLQFFFSNLFYLSGLSVLVYLVSPAIAILFDVKPFNEACFLPWLVAYGLFFVSNFGLGIALVKKHRIAAWILSTFMCMPYLAALFSTLVGARTFRWRVTNARSKGLVLKLLTPVVALLGTNVATGCLLATHVLALHRTLGAYYAWLVVDILIAIPLIARGYGVTATQGHMSVAEMSDALVGGSGKPAMTARPG
jgi:cellulose synthase (UDP-forming)